MFVELIRGRCLCMFYREVDVEGRKAALILFKTTRLSGVSLTSLGLAAQGSFPAHQHHDLRFDRFINCHHLVPGLSPLAFMHLTSNPSFPLRPTCFLMMCFTLVDPSTNAVAGVYHWRPPAPNLHRQPSLTLNSIMSYSPKPL